MDTLYSLSLSVALVAGGAGAILSGVVMSKAWHGRRRMLALAPIGGCIGLVSGAVSVAVHLYFGHGQAAAEPMEFAQFLVHHKSYSLVLTLCLVAFLGYFFDSGRARENGTAS